MKGRGERGQGVGARSEYLAHDVHLDAAHVVQRHVERRRAVGQAAVDGAQLAPQLGARLVDGEALERNGAQAAHEDAALGSHGLRQIHFGGAVDRNAELVACADHVVAGGRQLEVGREGELLVAENIVTVDPVQRILLGHLGLLVEYDLLLVLNQRVYGQLLLGVLILLGRPHLTSIRLLLVLFGGQVVRVEHARLVLSLQPLHLIDRNALALQRLHRLLDLHALGIALLGILQRLGVGDFLRHGARSAEDPQDQYD